MYRETDRLPETELYLLHLFFYIFETVMPTLGRALYADCLHFISADVRAIDITLDETTVAAKETTYICQSFNLEDYLPDPTKPYHVVGSEPLLANENVMHHIIVHGCEDGSEYCQSLKILQQEKDTC